MITVNGFQPAFTKRSILDVTAALDPLINGLNPISQIENNMYQLMVMILILLV